MSLKKIDAKWQKKWKEAGIFKAKKSGKKFYVLEMFSYPSGKIHMGHVRNYSIGDSYARFKRMQGFNVLYPMGFDSFGLPAENAAKKDGTNPKIWTENCIANMKKQLGNLGFSYDWDRMVETHKEEYYKWNQWLFLQMLKKRLVYRKEALVNWCHSCKTVLANEQVVNGKCWRCKSDVKEKKLEQWFFKITKYSDRLLKGIKKLGGWPENVRVMQENWIGRKEWIDIDYNIEDRKEKITVSTTRPDTNFGATFVVMAPEHPLLSKRGFIPTEQKKVVETYIKQAKKKTREERLEENRKKTGVFTGLSCINHLTKKKMPILVTDFVMMDVGTGAVVGVPGHDKRDFEFAKEFDLPIIRVVIGKDLDMSEITRMEQVQEDEGTMTNSGFLNGMDIHKATKKIMDYFEKNKWGKRVIRYRLRDWLISRQRYWGTPIPIIYCKKCGAVPVPEKDLPVKLPEDVNFKTQGNPMKTSMKFVNTLCPKCGGKAKRETDTMDTFVDSSWYFYRYCSPKSKEIFDRKAVNYWTPVNQYIGGIEHATGHLIYSRFITKFLKDMGYLKFDEYAKGLLTQGMVTKDGAKMSKSIGNVVDPDEMIDRYGADTTRLFMLSSALPEKELDWSDDGIEGTYRFLSRLHKMIDHKGSKTGSRDANLYNRLYKTIKEVTEYFEKMHFNLANTRIIEFINYLHKQKEFVSNKCYNESLKNLCLLIAPMTPHIAEEMWEKLGGKGLISVAPWPQYNKKLINPKIDAVESLLEQIIDDARAVKHLVKTDPKQINIYISPEWKYIAIKIALKNKKDPKRIMFHMMKESRVKMQKGAANYAVKLTKNVMQLKPVMERIVEYKIIKENENFISHEIGTPVKVMHASEGESERSQRGEPGKPGIEITS
ncbi:MAG: leucine--tRNA ligase [Nanoarchaeota archaeon]